MNPILPIKESSPDRPKPPDRDRRTFWPDWRDLGEPDLSTEAALDLAAERARIEALKQRRKRA